MCIHLGKILKKRKIHASHSCETRFGRRFFNFFLNSYSALVERIQKNSQKTIQKANVNYRQFFQSTLVFKLLVLIFSMSKGKFEFFICLLYFKNAEVLEH